jgi:hypothetical protein
MQPGERLGVWGNERELNIEWSKIGDFQCLKKRFYGDEVNKQAMKQSIKQKKCCYMDRNCTLECVAYTAISELSESAKEIGMNEMHCMRLLLDLSNLLKTMNSQDFDEEDEDII